MNIYNPLVSALIGALVGAATSIITVVVQTKTQSRRDRTKDAVALAIKDWEYRYDLISKRGGSVLPLAAFVHYHTKLIELAEFGKLTPESIKDLSEEQDQIIEAIEQINEGWIARAKTKHD